MLPRRLRLSRSGFEEARSLRRASSPHFSVSYGEHGSTGGTAVVVSKKVARSSVGRHLLKRRIVSVLRPYVSPSRTLIVHVRPGAAALPFRELSDELISLLGSILPAH